MSKHPYENEDRMDMQQHQPENFSREPRGSSQNEASNQRAVLERITIMLSHYWTGDDDPAVREAQLADWMDSLCKFPASIVTDACMEWMQTETKRPTIAAIFGLCRISTPAEKDRLKLPRPTTQYREYESERNRLWADAHDARQAWAEDHGFKNFSEVMQFGIQAAGRRPTISGK